MKLPQLTLRELFLLVVIAAMGCGWWVDRSRLAERFAARQDHVNDLVDEHQALLRCVKNLAPPGAVVTLTRDSKGRMVVMVYE